MKLRGKDGRLRAGWRILGFLVIFYALLIPVAAPVAVYIRRHHPDPALAAFLRGFPVALVATVAVAIARRRLDRRTVASLGLTARHGLADTVFGFVLSAVTVALSVAVLGLAGWATVRPASIDPLRLVLVFIGTAGAIAWWEELALRGYLFRNMAEGLGRTRAIVLASLLFGLMHAFNPHAGVVSTAIIIGISYMHIFGYLASGQLWLGLGMHAGWNFFQGGVFGMSVSGHGAGSLWTTTISGPGWASGGAFGIEASVFGVLYVGVGLAAIHLWCTRIVPRPPLDLHSGVPGRDGPGVR